MPTRFLIAGLHFFGIAAAVAIAVALLAPVDFVRFLGVMAFACAGTGFLLHLYALRGIDPPAFMALRFRFHAALDGVRSASSRFAMIVGGAPHSASSRLGSANDIRQH